MAKWIIDRTINLDEYKTRLVLQELLKNPRPSEDEMEKTLHEKNVLKNEGDGALKRRWFTYLRNYGLMEGDNVSEIGEIYSNGDLNLKELALLQLIKKKIRLANGNSIYPFKIFVLLFDELRNIDKYNFYLTREEFIHFVINIEDDRVESIKLIASRIVNERKNNTKFNYFSGEHDDIWFNTLKQTEVFKEIGRTLFVANEDFFNFIKSYYLNHTYKDDSYGKFNTDFISFIPLVKKDNSNFDLKEFEAITNGTKGLKNFLFSNKTIKEIDELYFNRSSKKFINMLSFLNLSIENLGIYSLFNNYKNIIALKFLNYDDNQIKAIGSILLENKKDENSLEGTNNLSSEFNVYGIHMTLKNSSLDEINPHVCIGWSGLGNLTNINSKDELKDHYLKLYPSINKYALGQNVTQIWLFKNEAQIGDYVVYFDKTIAHIGRIVGDYEYLTDVEKQDKDYVNNRRVEWIKDIPYRELQEDYRNSAKTQKSFFTLNSYKSLIEDIINDKNLDSNADDSNFEPILFDFGSSTIKDGKNLIVYGTPGCGKSYYVEHVLLDGYPKENYFRTTFFADYTNTDFVGQILPIVEGEKVTYKFNPGPFTLALAQAIRKPNEKVALVIEELNRGSAPSIFGDIFQLLDRKNGVSEYSITNINVIDYLNKEFEGQYLFKEVRIPSNLFIYATMNTSDQNVFTLDTAFKRRWEFKKLLNEFKDDHKFKDDYIPGADVTWKQLVKGINDYMLSLTDGYNNEDKQIGVYFVDETGMRKEMGNTSSREETEKFAYKVLEYLWDDVSKFAREKWFREDINSLDKLVEEYLKSGIEVFSDELKGKFNG